MFPVFNASAISAKDFHAFRKDRIFSITACSSGGDPYDLRPSHRCPDRRIRNLGALSATRAARIAVHRSKQAHPYVIGFMSWKWLILRPTLHFQVRYDMLPCRRCRFVTPAFADFLNPSAMVPEFAVAHPPRRTACKFVQPLVNIGERLAKTA